MHKAKQNTQLLTAMRTKLSTRCFLVNWARQNNIHCPDGYIKTYIEKHKKTYAVNAEDEWLRANGLTTVMYKELLSELALVDWIIHQKPHFFGINCNIKAEAQNERLLPVRDQQASYQEIGYSENDLEELSERYFLLEWAVQNGVSCPPDFVEKYTTQWETEHVIYNFVDWLNAKGLTFLEYRNLMSRRALVEWMIQQGPTYFGMFWNFDLAMLNELQITGHAMQLIEEMEVLC